MRKCLVAICHNWPVVFSKTAQSLMELGWGDRVARAKSVHGFDAIDHAWFFRSPRVDALRDMAAVAAQKEGYTHLLFLDADMVWPSDLLVKMLAHQDDGIVSGLYITKHPPYYPVALTDGKEQDGVTIYTHEKGFNPADASLRPVEVVGMGCTLIPMDVFDAIGPRPWFSYEDDADGWPMVSEDVPFCRRARAAGFRVSLAPGIACGHAHVDLIDKRHWRRYMDSERHTATQPVTPAHPPGSAA